MEWGVLDVVKSSTEGVELFWVYLFPLTSFFLNLTAPFACYSYYYSLAEFSGSRRPEIAEHVQRLHLHAQRGRSLRPVARQRHQHHQGDANHGHLIKWSFYH